MAISLKERKQAVFHDFKGVDFSSSPLLVNKNRAVNSTNFIYKNGINRKRNGWIEKFRIGTENINGLFECYLDSIKVIIVYAKTSFYKVTFENEEYSIEEITNTSSNDICKVDTSKLINRRCQMFQNKNRLYFVGCGDYLTYGKYGENYELRRVEDDDYTYIPTTSINIGADSDEDDIYESFENVNLLSSKRKNTFVGNIAGSIFTVDSDYIDNGTVITIEHEAVVEEKLTIKTYQSIGSDIFDDEQKIGSIDFEKGKITLDIDTSPIENSSENVESNLTITFSCKINDYADRINKAEIGVMYGVNGNPERLFVAGNNLYPNYDFYSEINDLTYFSDLNSTEIGLTNSKITGYSVLDNGILAIHKDERNSGSTIYYRSGTEKTEFDDNGQIINQITTFTIKAGSIGECLASKYCNANFNGDKIFLSKNGVYGIVLSSNIASNERYSRERSQYIKRKLLSHINLEEAVAIVYENNYYLSIDDICYVADARIISNNTSETNSFNYEWYYWNNIPARVWAIIDNKLYFGTKDGRICAFDKEYADITFKKTSIGDLFINYDENKVIFNQNLVLKNNDLIRFNTDIYKSKILSEDIIKVENNKVFVSEEKILNCYNLSEIYVDKINDSGLEINKKYYINNVDLAECSFNLTDELGNEISILSSNFCICENISNKDLIITNLTDTTFNLSYKNPDLEEIKLVKYNDSIEYQTPQATIVTKKNVVAMWFSPIFDFGNNQLMKTLLSFTVSTEPTTNGKLTFGYTTKNNEKSIAAEGINIFDFDNLDFNNFTFDSSFANSYTVDIKDYFNFIQLFFMSDNDYACAVNSITLSYKYNSTNKGVQ